jgi:hypothetical protein
MAVAQVCSAGSKWNAHPAAALTLAGACITVRSKQPVLQEETLAEANLQMFPERLPVITSVFGVPVREDIAFSDAKGRENKGVRKASEQALERLQGILARLLAPNETVLLVSTAQGQVATFDALFVGLIIGVFAANALSRSCLVVTNQRFLRFRIRSSRLTAWSWDEGVSSLLCGDTAEVKKGSILGNQLIFLTRGGARETYSGLSRPFTAKLRKLLPVLLPVNAGAGSSAGTMVALCPRCLAGLAPQIYECPQCSQAFKNEKRLLWRTILIPGGEYFYVGHAVMGIFQGLIELILLLVTLAAVIATPDVKQEGAWVAAVVLFLFLLAHKFSGWLGCRRLVRTYLPVK